MLATTVRKWWKFRVKFGTGIPTFPRSLGFKSIYHRIKRRLEAGADDEEAKVIITSSYRSGITRNLIHIFPASALIVLLWVNFQRFYLGPVFRIGALHDGLALGFIQVGAKVIELACIASLTTIVLHAMRHELLRDGLPLGLLGSGIFFSSLNAFVSQNFLGSFNWKRGFPRYNRKWPFYMILVICGVIAATIAPVSAILMIPQSQWYQAGGASFILPGDPLDIIPTILTSEQTIEVCNSTNATSYAVCPSAGFTALRSIFLGFNYLSFCSSAAGDNYIPVCQAQGISVTGDREWDSFLIDSPLNTMPPVLSLVRSGNEEATATQPHAASANILQQIASIWVKESVQQTDWRTSQYQFSNDLISHGSGEHPFVRTRCTEFQNLSSIATHAEFPWLTTDNRGWNVSIWNDGLFSLDHTFRNASIETLNRNKTSLLRAQWVTLPIDSFGDRAWGMTTNGVLIEMPWSGDSRAVVGCAIASSWHEATIQSSRLNNYGAYSVYVSDHAIGVDIDSPTAKAYQLPILLTDSWLSQLTAAVPVDTPFSTNMTRSTLEALCDAVNLGNMPSDFRTKTQITLQNGICAPGKMNRSLTDTQLLQDNSCGKGAWRYLMEAMLSMLVADGISRSGSQHLFSIQPDLADWKLEDLQTYNTSSILHGALADLSRPTNDALKRWMVIYIVGYAWNPDSVAEYLAIAGAFVYLTVVLCFLVYSFVRKGVTTSTSWKSITELLVLCLNSTPPGEDNLKLRNASAGIDHMKTFRATVRVRALYKDEDPDRPGRVQLIVVNDETSNASSGVDSSATSIDERSSSGSHEMDEVAVQGTNSEEEPLAASQSAYISVDDGHDAAPKWKERPILPDEKYV